MTLPQVNQLFRYWSESPPVHELIAIALRVYTTWRPNAKPMTRAEHQASLEARWNCGALNVKQLFEMTQGTPVSLYGAPG